MRTIELTGKINALNLEFTTGKTLLTLEINEKQAAKNLYDELHKADKLSIEIDKYRDKRSLEANRYMWVLCGKLAERLSDTTKVRHTKEDIYQDAIRKMGVWKDDEIEPQNVKWRCASWEMLGTGWLTERVDFTADGKKEIIRFYYGSSQYNKAQMSRLIDSLVQDCESVGGIETKTPNEIAKMVSLWKKER